MHNAALETAPRFLCPAKKRAPPEQDMICPDPRLSCLLSQKRELFPT
jgi:hypothetical protein